MRSLCTDDNATYIIIHEGIRTLMLMPEFNIHSFKAASTNSDMDVAPSKTSREASKPSPVQTSVAESC